MREMGNEREANVDKRVEFLCLALITDLLCWGSRLASEGPHFFSLHCAISLLDQIKCFHSSRCNSFTLYLLSSFGGTIVMFFHSRGANGCHAARFETLNVSCYLHSSVRGFQTHSVHLKIALIFNSGVSLIHLASLPTELFEFIWRVLKMCVQLDDHEFKNHQRRLKACFHCGPLVLKRKKRDYKNGI